MSNLALETSIPTKTSLSDFTGSFREVLGISGCPTCGYGLEAHRHLFGLFPKVDTDDLRSRASI